MLPHIGTSGYVYPHWRKGVFYPSGLRPADELPYYATRFGTVELNSPFYRVPRAGVFARWREAVPGGFVFSVKANREITHLRRLAGCNQALGELLQHVRELDLKLGPILFQLPPSMWLDLTRLARFIACLPQSQRWAVEFRHPSWHRAEVYELLARHGIALVIPVGGRVAPDLVTTAPFTYIRMHAGRRPDGRFTTEELRNWAARVRALCRSGKEVYLYFNNDWNGMAALDAAALWRMVNPDYESASVKVLSTEC